MKRAILTLLIGVVTSSAFALDRHPRLFAPARFHACVFAAWVDDYCRFHSYDDLTFRACFIANGGRPCGGALVRY